jgi:two-component system phosphate regulon sensor histidine kinase PhoR
VARHFGAAAEAKGLDFTVQFQARPTMMAQSGHLRSLWRNLIDNAIKYTPTGTVTVSLDESSGHLIGTVKDTGIGVETEELPSIFQEFYRSEAAKAEVKLGTGLGLPIVDQILKVYQGTIQVDSEPGKGSTFTIKIPI